MYTEEEMGKGKRVREREIVKGKKGKTNKYITFFSVPIRIAPGIIHETSLETHVGSV